MTSGQGDDVTSAATNRELNDAAEAPSALSPARGPIRHVTAVATGTPDRFDAPGERPRRIVGSEPVTMMTPELMTVADSIRRELLFSQRKRERNAIANLARGIRDALALDLHFYRACGLDPQGYPPARPASTDGGPSTA
jgi:hypothetical protein